MNINIGATNTYHVNSIVVNQVILFHRLMNDSGYLVKLGSIPLGPSLRVINV